jgi:chemosensory pili system protein ChpA (sensor histidine kinase/response regulator)
MTPTAQIGFSSLAEVKPGLEGSLVRAAQGLEKFFRNPEAGQQSLLGAVEEFRGTFSALQSLSLDGAIVFCTEIDKVLQELASGSLAPTSRLQDSVRQALFALIHYLDGLLDASNKSALGLFPQYQKLRQSHDGGQAFEVELFFPDLQVDLPAPVLAQPMEDSPQELVRAERSKYQAALLKWLRQGFAADDLQAMRNAVLAVMRCVPQDRHNRAFWWVVTAMLDCLINDGSPTVLSTMKLLSRIDLRMKSLAEGHPADPDGGMNELLYLVACSHAVSDTITEVKQVYALDNVFPRALSLPPSKTDPILEAMRAQLGMAQEGWERSAYLGVVSPEFARQQFQLSSLADQLDHNTLQYLCSLIQTVVEQARNPEQIRRIQFDMAAALLLLGSGIEHYRSLGDEFHKQTRILGHRLQAALAGEPSDEPQEDVSFIELVTLYRGIAARDVEPLVATEILASLDLAEQGLGEFFVDAGKRSSLEPLGAALKQAHCLLRILSLEQAVQLLLTVQQAIDRYSAAVVPEPDEKQAVTAALNALKVYVQDLAHGNQPDIAPLLVELQHLQALQLPVAAPVSEAGAAPQVAAARSEGNELLDVFLEEAGEVLERIRANLEIIHSRPDDKDALVTIRRNFHTLKGSGRMVGLTELGDVAAAVEGAMNKWLQSEKPATPGLLKFIDDAAAAFHGWVDSLMARGSAQIEAADLVSAAQRIASGDAQAAPAAMPSTAAAPRPEAVEVQAEGNELLDVFLEEAGEVLEKIRANLEIIHSRPDDKDALVTIRRSFHTLKGSGRMVGLTELGDVAAAVEGAMNKWLQSEKPATPALLKFVDDAAAAFHGWVDSLMARGSALIEAADLVSAAQRIAAAIGAAPASIPGMAEQPIQVPKSVEAKKEPAPPAAPPAELVVIGSVKISPTLFAIATEESAQHISELHRCLDILRREHTPISNDFMRAAHTLAGVNRILGFPQIADLAFALEQWLLARMNRPFAVLDSQISLLDQAIAALDEMSKAVVGKSEPQGQPDLISRLQDDKHMPEADSGAAAHEVLTAKIPGDRELPPETAQEVTGKSGIFGLRAGGAKKTADEAAQKAAQEIKVIRDEVDEQMLPIFLEEANELFPKISEGLRAWRAHPDDKSPPNNLQRSLHTLKGGARMAGAMRLGEQAHQMESCVVQAVSIDNRDAATWEELDNHLDRIGSTLERLRSGESTIAGAIPEVQQLQVVEVAVAQSAQSADAGRMVKDDVDEQLLPIFLEEANELIPQIGSSIKAWKEHPDNNTISRKLQRDLHTLKGGARMAGAMRLGELIHLMETQVTQGMVDELHESTFWGELERYFDRTGTSLERLFGSELAEPAKKPEAIPEAKPEAKPEAAAEARVEPAGGAPAQPAKAVAERQKPATMLRVRSDTLDYLVNEAGEISVTRSRIEAELRGVKAGLLELLHSVVRLRHQLREIEIQAEGQMQARVSVVGDMAEQFDPLEFDRFTRFQELTRFMNESVHDVQTVQQNLLKNLDETAAALSAQNQINRALQQNLLAIRMVPFSSVSERLYRIVRQTCKELNKKANLELYGTEVELDRSVLEKMTAPFEHLLRNAIAHGLESAEQRARLDKPSIGDVRLSLRQEGNEVVFEFSDDGAGLDIERLRRKGVEQGHFQADEEVSDEQAMQLIFAPGLSTAEAVTAISGRGVGMDVVRSEITALGGRIDVFSVPQKGTRFVIHLPLTLLVTHTLMMQAGQTIYAVPSNMVEQVQQVKPAAMEEAYRVGRVDWQGERYPLHYMLNLLEDGRQAPEIRPYNALILLRSGDQRIAVHVDALIGIQEVVVKNIGPQLSRLPGIAGATVLGNGSVLLILNPIQLSQRISQGVHKVTREITLHPPTQQPLVMVVDDSLTVRKITSRLLTRAGYLVQTAEDGVDALEKLDEVTPGVILMDIEMPRMDGFELTRILHNNSKTKDLPIIMITSRTADKHRDYAKELGVNDYLGKPYQEEDLLQKIAHYAPITKTLH